ncbi:hypothetical protein MTO96_012342 [Rhipicephalus appendiculatus]
MPRGMRYDDKRVMQQDMRSWLRLPTRLGIGPGQLEEVHQGEEMFSSVPSALSLRALREQLRAKMWGQSGQGLQDDLLQGRLCL